MQKLNRLKGTNPLHESKSLNTPPLPVPQHNVIQAIPRHHIGLWKAANKVLIILFNSPASWATFQKCAKIKMDKLESGSSNQKMNRALDGIDQDSESSQNLSRK